MEDFTAEEKRKAAKFVNIFHDLAPRLEDAHINWKAVDGLTMSALKKAYKIKEGKS